MHIGKTWLARYLVATEAAAYFQSGKKADIAKAYNSEPLVVFDYTRSSEEYISYTVLESLKNGLLFSAKYESVTKKFRPAKIICFANFEPKWDAMSADRWDVREILEVGLLVHTEMPEAPWNGQPLFMEEAGALVEQKEEDA